MANISTWSKTAGNNNSAPPDGFPEGMAPSAVNDSARELMAAVRTQWEGGEWFDWGHTPTYVNTTSFTVPTDLTAVYHVGRRLKFTDASTLYGAVASVSFASSITTVTVIMDSGVLSASLTAVGVGVLSKTNSSIPNDHVQNTDTGTTSTTFAINSGGSAGTVGTANLTGNKTFELPDTAGSVVVDATLNDGSLPASVTTLTTSGAATINSSLSASGTITTDAGVVSIKETTTPTATANYGKVYTKSDNDLYFQDGAGAENKIVMSNRAGVRMVRTSDSANDGSGGVWVVYDETGAPISTAGTTTDGLQEAINYCQEFGHDLDVYGGGYIPGVYAEPYGADLPNPATVGTWGLNPLATVSGTKVITVTHTGHGYATGDSVWIVGATATNGIPASEINNVLFTITVVDANSYTVTVSTTNATSTGAGGGSTVTALQERYDISIILANSGIVFKPINKMTVKMRGVSLIFTAAVTGPGITFDSTILMDFKCDGQIGYAGNSSAILFKPTNHMPASTRQIAMADSRFVFTAVATYTSANSPVAAIEFDCVNGAISNCIFEAVEINAIDANTGVKIDGQTKGFTGNVFKAGEIHGSGTVGLDVGVDATGGANTKGNVFQIGAIEPITGDGLELWGTDNVFQIGQINNAEGTVTNAIDIKSSAERNNITVGLLQGTNKVVDGATLQSNRIQYSSDFAIVYNNVTQSIANSTWQKVVFNTETKDTTASFASNTFTLSVGGAVSITAGIAYAAPVDGVHGSIAVYKNGAVLRELNMSFSGTQAPQGANISIDDLGAAGDTYSIYAIQRSGAAMNLSAGAQNTWATFRRV